MREGDILDQFFIGPKSELRRFFKEAVELVVDDYIFWRRNFHPKDLPAIPYHMLQSDEAMEYRGRFHQELFELISDLKLDVPFFSPRYMAHMVSEVAMPGLVAYLATMLYNPNNVSLEASPVTATYEREVGRQFAELFGFDPQTAFGHLCSGGTVANYESLWLHRAGRFLPLGIAIACDREKIDRPADLPTDLWALLNVSMEDAEPLWNEFRSACEVRELCAQTLLRRWSLDHFGDAEYRLLTHETFGETYASPVVLVPVTAHYSWKRAAGLLGLGRKNFVDVDVDAGFHMDPGHYGRLLDQCLADRRPILQSVFVLGNTEFGTVDPVARLLAIRDKARRAGLDSPVHVDAAYGGYFATIFKPSSGTSRDAAELRVSGTHELSTLSSGCAVLPQTDSVTVDPHKMGYAPYGAGAIVVRHGYLRHLVAEGAAYALDSRGLGDDLGKFILEGSKPGAAAAAVFFNHRMMPLHSEGYGRHLLDLCHLARDFHHRVLHRSEIQKSEGEPFRFLSLVEPETNIAALLVLPLMATRLSEVDEFNHFLSLRFGAREVDSVQSYDYLVSKTCIEAHLPLVTQHEQLSDLERNVDSLTCLRLVFMNRWVEGETFEGDHYMDGFLNALSDVTRQYLEPGSTSVEIDLKQAVTAVEA